jgi:F0F1-type ATP synthase delta subunit
MRTKDYIKAAHALITEGKSVDAVMPSLKKYLEARGLMKVYPSVLRSLIEKVERSEKRNGVHVRVARADDAGKHAPSIDAHLASHNLPKTYTTSIDETIIGGYTITTKNTRIDQSYKHKLLTAYRTLID